MNTLTLYIYLIDQNVVVRTLKDHPVDAWEASYKNSRPAARGMQRTQWALSFDSELTLRYV